MPPIFRWTLLTALLVIFAAPDVMAQSVLERARERAIENARQQAERDRDARDRDDRYERDRDDRDRYERERQRDDRNRRGNQRARQQNQRGGQAGGPPFCRNGQGHPVHGMRWCYEKGFATSNSRYGDVIWQRGSLGDVRIDRRRAARQTLDERDLRGVIGREATDRARQHGRSMGLRGDLHGRWIDASTLELVMGNRPIVRLTDRNRNGRVDATQLARYR